MTRRHLVPPPCWSRRHLPSPVAVAGRRARSSPPRPRQPPTPLVRRRTLDGTVGPGIRHLPDERRSARDHAARRANTSLNVDDQADIHNFHLTGPGVDVSTDVPFKGKKSFTITLQAGKYHFQCDPHSSAMNGDFTVS